MAEKVRVLHVINSLGAGGAELSLAEMLPVFDRAGITSSVVCLSRAHLGMHDAVEQSGYSVQVVGPSRLRSLRRLRSIIQDWRPDVVHTTIYDADILGRLASAATPCRVLTSLVSTTYDGVRVADRGINRGKLAAARTLDAATARLLTDHFHAISPAVKASAVKHLRVPPERITVVERGRNLTRLGEPSPERRSMVRRDLGLSTDAEVVLNVGRQEYAKGHTFLLDAVAKLVATRPNIVLLQAGRPGKASPELRQAALDVGVERVRFLGHRKDIGDLLSAADVFAFPSVYEGLGGSVLEAMAMRVPVVVTEIPALVDVVEHGRGAVVVPAGDPSALAMAISQLLDHPGEAQQMADRAQQIFQERFTLERSVDGMVGLYRNVLADGKVH